LAAIDAHIWDPDRIHVVLIGGPGGSGKSTLAGEIVKHTGFAIVDKDDANDLSEALLVAKGSTADDRTSPVYVEYVRKLEYDTTSRNISRNIMHGTSVIAVAPFGPEFADSVWRKKFEQDCEIRAGGRPVAVDYIMVHVDDAVLRRRLTERKEPRDAGHRSLCAAGRGGICG
jgi:predicted kinase